MALSIWYFILMSFYILHTIVHKNGIHPQHINKYVTFAFVRCPRTKEFVWLEGFGRSNNNIIHIHILFDSIELNIWYEQKNLIHMHIWLGLFKLLSYWLCVACSLSTEVSIKIILVPIENEIINQRDSICPFVCVWVLFLCCIYKYMIWNLSIFSNVTGHCRICEYMWQLLKMTYIYTGSYDTGFSV